MHKSHNHAAIYPWHYHPVETKYAEAHAFRAKLSWPFPCENVKVQACLNRKQISLIHKQINIRVISTPHHHSRNDGAQHILVMIQSVSW